MPTRLQYDAARALGRRLRGRRLSCGAGVVRSNVTPAHFRKENAMAFTTGFWGWQQQAPLPRGAQTWFRWSHACWTNHKWGGLRSAVWCHRRGLARVKRPARLGQLMRRPAARCSPRHNMNTAPHNRSPLLRNVVRRAAELAPRLHAGSTAGDRDLGQRKPLPASESTPAGRAGAAAGWSHRPGLELQSMHKQVFECIPLCWSLRRCMRVGVLAKRRRRII